MEDKWKMDRAIKVSVILPLLNAAAYIRECMDSILNQSLQEIEVICVDAGSVDGSLEILREYAGRDSRVQLRLSGQKSYGAQMNIGIRTAAGEYIGIVEADDYIPREMYEELYDIAKKNQADLVKTDFYRFTGVGSGLCKKLYRLTENHSLYNRVIHIAEEQECFRFPVNTWNGIYNRKFLLEHHIEHNETPGASFQDNGFWFQTFMHAGRAYFADKPYYMNRRDNPASSVFSKDKTFCVCDEFQFIWNRLKQDECLFQKFKYTYAFACYQAYKGNLNRIADSRQKEFLQKFSNQFREFDSQGLLDRRLFSDKDWHMLGSIIKDPEDFYERIILPGIELFAQIRKAENIIIYGVGTAGKRILNQLMHDAHPVNVLCFAVTDLNGNPAQWQGVPVYRIYDLLEYRERALVVTAAQEAHQLEMQGTLEQLGFVNWTAV